MSIRISIIGCALLTLFLSGCHINPTVERGEVAIENDDMRAVLVFSDGDRARIRQHYKGFGKDKAMPPGLAKKQQLPPGLQKHIEKNGQLPPGLEGRRLPLDLESTLSRLPEGFVRLRVGGDVVLLNEKTRVVLDVIWDVVN